MEIPSGWTIMGHIDRSSCPTKPPAISMFEDIPLVIGEQTKNRDKKSILYRGVIKTNIVASKVASLNDLYYWL